MSKQLQLTVVNPTSSIHNEIKKFMDRSKEVLSGDVQILNERDLPGTTCDTYRSSK